MTRGAAALAILVLVAACGPVTSAPSASPAIKQRDLGRDVLAANDGWASSTTGTSGGARAHAPHTKTASDPPPLGAALDPSDPSPKPVYVSRASDPQVDGGKQPLPCG